MSDLLQKCAVCGGLLDAEDLFCVNCGTEAPSRAGVKPPPVATSTCNFQCAGCGASMSYDASAGALRCPFCGSAKLEQRPDALTVTPQRVVPLSITREKAILRMRQWLGNGYWRPGDLSEKAIVANMTPVYLPYWIFAARTHTNWAADTNHTPPGARASWYPVTGEHQGEHEGLLVGASGTLTMRETAELCPFDLAAAVPTAHVDLINAIYEQFSTARKHARPLARQGIEALEAQDCRPYVPGECRNLKVNTLLTDLTSEPVLLPVWIMAYRYQDRVFRFLVNGQTGRSTGQAPMSWRKISGAIAVMILVVVIVLAVLAVVARGESSSAFMGAASVCYITANHVVAGGTGVPPVLKRADTGKMPVPHRRSNSQKTSMREPVLQNVIPDDEDDRDLRPQRMRDMIGQREVYARIEIAVDAAAKRGEPLGHILFDGPPGLGKTTFATCIPKDLGVSYQIASGAALAAPKDVLPYLTNAEEGSVLFIDEIHRLPKAVEEFLYPAMEDFRIDIALGEGVNARTINMALRRFTLIGATTRAGLISAPMRDRFQMREHLDFYSVDELAEIVRRSSVKLKIPLDEPSALEIARRSRGTPRLANNRLRWVRDFATSKADGRINLEVARAALAMQGIDTLGLDGVDRKYLETIIRVFQGGPVGVEAVAHTMNTSTDTLADEVEPYLLRSELVIRTPRGRKVTAAAYDHLGLGPVPLDDESRQRRLFA